jgi:hypothetical protein
MTRTRVGIVVDKNFGARLAHLARVIHVWTVESPVNTPLIREFWRTETQFVDGEADDSGITSFTANDEETPEQICVRIVGDVNEHHCGHFGEQPWTELHVFGTELTKTLREAFEEFGATSFEPTRDGFICRREPVETA